MLVLFLVLACCGAMVAPHEGAHVSNDVELPMEGEFYFEVLGELTKKPSWKPIVVFLCALNEDNTEDGRIDKFQDRVGDATFVLVIPPYRYIESRKQVLRAWYDFVGYIRKPSNLVNYDESQRYLTSVVQRLQQLGRPVYLAGYGQGCAMALDVALAKPSASKFDRPVDGAICFSGYLIDNEHDDRALQRTKVLWAHSQRDMQLSFATARFNFDQQLTKERKLKRGQFVIFENKKGHGHVFNEESIDLLVDFIKGRPIPPTKGTA